MTYVTSRKTSLFALLVALACVFMVLATGCGSSSGSGGNLLATTQEAQSQGSADDSSSGSAASSASGVASSSAAGSSSASSASGASGASTDWLEVGDSASDDGWGDVASGEAAQSTEGDGDENGNADDASAADGETSAAQQETTTQDNGPENTSTSKSSEAQRSSSENESAASSDERSASSDESDEASPADSNTITVSIEFDCSNAHAYNSKYPSSLGEFTVELQPGATVYDALVATGIDFSMKGSDYISSIGGVAEKQCGATSGWMYSVDGKFPSKPATSYTLDGGESIRWAYTAEMGDV